MTDINEEINLLNKLNTDVVELKRKLYGTKYSLQHNVNGVRMNVGKDFKFSIHKEAVNNRSWYSSETKPAPYKSPYPQPPNPQVVRENNRASQPVPGSRRVRQPGPIIGYPDQVSKAYGKFPTPPYKFAIDCTGINLESSKDTPFAYWEYPPYIDRKDKTIKIKMEQVQYHNGKLNLWYSGTEFNTFRGLSSLRQYFSCFQNGGIEEIYITCIDIEDMQKRIENLNIEDLEVTFIKEDEEDRSESSEGDDDVPNDIDADSRKVKKITVHLITWRNPATGGSYVANSMGIISGLFVIAVCAIFPR